MRTFTSLKQTTKQDQEKRLAAIQKMNSGGFEKDERYWQPTVDAAKNGYAVIRFLPVGPKDPEEHDYPWVVKYTHSFKGPTGKWYIENSRTTIDQDDPVGEWNAKMWAKGEGTKEQKFVQDHSKRRKSFISNIYVVNDKAKPENNGKVFLFEYGAQIFNKLSEKMTPPEDDDEKPIDPFSMFDNGANFKLKIRDKDGYRNYESSEFATPAALFDDEREGEAVFNKIYSLTEEISEDKFKSYDDLKRKLELVLGAETEDTRSSKSDEATPPWDEDEETKPKEKPAKAQKEKPAAKTKEKEPEPEDGDDDYESLLEELTNETTNE